MEMKQAECAFSCRLKDVDGQAKENIDIAAIASLKAEEDVALQQPAEDRSGLDKPLFWVDLEMTGRILATVQI